MLWSYSTYSYYDSFESGTEWSFNGQVQAKFDHFKRTKWIHFGQVPSVKFVLIVIDAFSKFTIIQTSQSMNSQRIRKTGAWLLAFARAKNLQMSIYSSPSAWNKKRSIFSSSISQDKLRAWGSEGGLSWGQIFYITFFSILS